MLEKSQMNEIEYHLNRIAELLKSNTHFGTEMWIKHLFKEKCIRLTKTEE